MDPNGGQGSVTATSNHPFWVDSQKTWINAGNLKTGERLRTDDGHSATVTGLHTHDEITQVYNLTVDGTHLPRVTERDHVARAQRCTERTVQQGLQQCQGAEWPGLRASPDVGTWQRRRVQRGWTAV
ncbi:polymorphic toxin-type HINT domain-containing protein [Kutzneria sp. NPDC052558]|uniref:polymorphic toxin-type HINT domain-containing protein n=1 Tax=Kutzneria sp. NPDC052558 TaxID=3364121 RepID=UPI0037C85336